MIIGTADDAQPSAGANLQLLLAECDILLSAHERRIDRALEALDGNLAQAQIILDEPI